MEGLGGKLYKDGRRDRAEAQEVAGEPCGKEHRGHNTTEQSSAVYRIEQDWTQIEQDRKGGQNRTRTERERAQVNRTQQEEESQKGSRQDTHGRTVNRTSQDRTSQLRITGRGKARVESQRGRGRSRVLFG